MKKLIATAAIACAGSALLIAQAGTEVRSQAPAAAKPATAAKAAAQAVPAGDAKTYRAFVNQYCISCHNSKSAQPSADPVDLEKASLDDLLPSAATWERVLNKLSVRAMPPQGMAHPKEADYANFTAWLANSLDQAWAARGTLPGRYVVHRLNRTEYGNAIR